MIRRTYASKALKDWSPEELLALLKVCRDNNSARGITGMLVYSDRTFFQILEGEEKDVNEVYKIIAQDPRHTDVATIETKKITEREFPYWSMGFENLDPSALKDLEGVAGMIEGEDRSLAAMAYNKDMVGPLMRHLRSKMIKAASPGTHEELPMEHDDPFIRFLHISIRTGVKVLAFLMVIVIMLGILDVVFVMYDKMSEPPYFHLSINELLQTFGAFLAVLIAIEIFLNITLYIRSDVIPVKLVVATGLMAISRKIIVFDYHELNPEFVSGSAMVVLALGITYWLLDKKH
jgi:uncharacterized membrane protein (DUF373 family)